MRGVPGIPRSSCNINMQDALRELEVDRSGFDDMSEADFLHAGYTTDRAPMELAAYAIPSITGRQAAMLAAGLLLVVAAAVMMMRGRSSVPSIPSFIPAAVPAPNEGTAQVAVALNNMMNKARKSVNTGTVSNMFTSA